MIANQLDNADNTVGTLLTGFPTGTTLYKWDESAQQFVNTSYLTDHWSSPSMTLHPGEGAIPLGLHTNPLSKLAKRSGPTDQVLVRSIGNEYSGLGPENVATDRGRGCGNF